MRYLARRAAALIMSVAMMAAVFVGNGVTAFAIGREEPYDMSVDLLIDGDTAHNAAHKVNAGQELTLTGRGNAYEVKNLLKEAFEAEEWYGLKFTDYADQVQLKDYNGNPGVVCWFTATMTIPKELVVDENNITATLDTDMFEIKDENVTYDPTTRTISAKMTLTNNYTTLQALLDDMDKLSDDQVFNMDVTGVSVPDDAKVGDQYTISGTMGTDLNGTFNQGSRFWTNYGYIFGSRPSRWAVYFWTGVQTADGADSVAPDGINLTLEVVDKPVEPAAPAEEEEHQRCHHKHRYWDVVKKGTQTEDGVMRYRCTDCGDVEYEVPIAAYFIFNKDTQQDILKAAPNATVVARTPIFISFHEMVQEALVERPDVTLVVDYRSAGKDYEMTIPAGSGQTLDQLFGESQYAGFLYLGGAFATTEVAQ